MAGAGADMREQGVVRSVAGGQAEVVMAPAAVDGCGDCRRCETTPEGRVLTALALPGLAPGQRVEVEVEPQGTVGPAVVGFLLPVVALIMGAALGSAAPSWMGLSALSPTFGAVLGALTLLGLALLPARAYDRALRRRPVTARIIEVIP